MNSPMASDRVDMRWHGLYLAASWSARGMFALIIIQIAVYSIWQPPADAAGMLSLMETDWLLGLLSMDLLYLVDCVLLIVIYLALYVAIRKHGESAMLVATVLGCVGIAAYFSSNPAFEMLYLGQALRDGPPPAERQLMMAAGRSFIETYRGTAFNVYYVLNTLYLFLVTPVVRRSGLFDRVVVMTGFAAAILMLLPSSAGIAGLVASLASLVPWMIWLLAVSRRFDAFARWSRVG